MSKNIKVAIRVRPLIQREKNEKSKEQWEVNENFVYPIDIVTRKKSGDPYMFDHIFNNKCRNEDIYRTVANPVVNAAIDGFNGTIFAYGQTSSGKTHTMTGSVQEPGVISLAVENIFQIISRSSNRKFLLRVSYMEIYNEKIYDLLDIGKSVKTHEDCNGEVVVDVKYVVTDTADKVYNIMKKGDKARKIGETSMNEKSSRSHTIFRIIIESTDAKDTNGVVNVAQLNLVDLAGSERPTLTKATGLRLKEGAHINKSLSVLSLVMKQLSESQDFINFRDSKLTRILQSSLGGNALTAIICAVTPAALEETHSTLAFASRAKTIKNIPHQNEVLTDEALITRYAIQVDKLKHELEKATVHNRDLQVGQHEQALANSRLRERIALMEKSVLTSADACSKTSSSSSKYRRRTWCSSVHSPGTPLPVIYEADILETKLKCDIEITENEMNQSILVVNRLDIDEFPFDDCELDLIENEKFCLGTLKKDQSELLQSGDQTETSPPVTPTRSRISSTQSETDTVSEEPEEYVQWLVSATQTPESVLRQRATYYEREFLSLKELTNKERELLASEQSAELEAVKLELEQLKYVQEFERSVKDDMENKYKQEKKDLLDELQTSNKKNFDLTQKISQAQDVIQKLNDNEVLMEMYRNKYKRREEELLACLNEAREICNVSSKMDIPEVETEITIESENFVQTIKAQLSLLRCEIDSGEPIDQILKILNDIVKNYKSAVDDMNADSEEVQELSSAIKYMLEIFSVALNNDNLLQEIEDERDKLKNKLTHLQVAQQSFDILYREKNKEITSLTEQLAECKRQLDKSETASSVLKKDCDDYRELHKEKDKEIEDLSDQIMGYIDQLAGVEKDLLKLTTVSKSEKSTQTTNKEDVMEQGDTKLAEYTAIFQQKDLEILELSEKLMSRSTQLSELEIVSNVYKKNVTSQMDNNRNLIIAKDDEILQLSHEVMEYVNKISALDEQVKTHEVISLTMADTLKIKAKEIRDFTETIQDYESQLMECQEKLRIYELVTNSEAHTQTDDYENDLILLKETEMKAMTDKIEQCTIQLTAYEVQINALKSMLNAAVECESDDQDKMSNYTHMEIMTAQMMVYILEIELYKSRIKTYESVNKKVAVECQTDDYEEQIKENESVARSEVECQTDDYENEIIALKEAEIEECLTKISMYEYQQKLDQISPPNKRYYEPVKYPCFTCRMQTKEIEKLQERLKDCEQKSKQRKEHIKQLSAKIEQILAQALLEREKLKKCVELKQKQGEPQAGNHGGISDQPTAKVEMGSQTDEYEGKMPEHQRKKLSKLNDKVMHYMTYINKLKAENLKMKHEIGTKNTYKQALIKQNLRLIAELEAKCKALETEQIELVSKIEALEIQNTKWKNVADYLQQQAHEKNISCSSLTKSVEILQQENADLRDSLDQSKSEMHKVKEIVDSTTSMIEATQKERDACKEMLHTLENSLGDAQHELHELKYKENVKQKRIQRQSLQDSSRSLSPSYYEDESTVSDTACSKCKEYEVDLNQYQVRMDLLESQLTIANDCERCKEHGLGEKAPQSLFFSTELCRAPRICRSFREQRESIEQLLKTNEDLLKKNEQLKELCKLRKFKLDQFEQQMRSPTK